MKQSQLEVDIHGTDPHKHLIKFQRLRLQFPTKSELKWTVHLEKGFQKAYPLAEKNEGNPGNRKSLQDKASWSLKMSSPAEEIRNDWDELWLALAWGARSAWAGILTIRLPSPLLFQKYASRVRLTTKEISLSILGVKMLCPTRRVRPWRSHQSYDRLL